MNGIDYNDEFFRPRLSRHHDRNRFYTDLFSTAPAFAHQTVHWHKLISAENRPRASYRFSDCAQDLKNNGYLASIPRDPGFGPNSHEHYIFVESGDLFCCKHGFTQVPKGCERGAPPREQLLAIGVTDPSLLDMASPVSVFQDLTFSDKWKRSMMFIELHMLPLFFLIAFLWARGKWRKGLTNVAIAVSTYSMVVLIAGRLYFQPTSATVINASLSIVTITLGIEACWSTVRILLAKDLKSAFTTCVNTTEGNGQ